MKPSPFAYRRVAWVEEGLERLTEFGADAKLLAGGQSLVPMLALRLAAPTALIDISRVASLQGVAREGDRLRIGAATRHCELGVAGVTGADEGYRVLERVVPWIGHAPIRSRGTIGGSLAHADPAAEWPILAVLLDAELVIASPRGERILGIDEFLLGFFTTALDADEMLTEIRFNRPWRGATLHEHARRHGDFALVAAATALDLDERGRCSEARVVLGAIDDRPLRMREAEDMLAGEEPSPDLFAEVAARVAAEVEPASDAHASADYRRHLAAGLTGRALADSAARARGEEAPV